jgi:general secretion pathway protein H
MRQRGFSLLELLMVIVLVALMMALVGTSISRSVSNAELRSASRGLLAALRYTQMHAIVSHQEQVLTIDMENLSYQPPDRDMVTFPEGIEVSMVTAESELLSERVGGIRFFPDGGSTGGSVTIHVKDREYEINIAWLTGEARMSRLENG